MFVKTCLVLNYFGQGVWLLHNVEGKTLSKSVFYSIMPESFLYVGIGIATAAAIIAGQALISGSFTLVSETLRLNLWPKMKLNYPTEEKGQLFIPGINTLLFVGCSGIILYFQTSAHMQAAYGLAITLCMISTSILFTNYLISRRINRGLIWLYLMCVSNHRNFVPHRQS